MKRSKIIIILSLILLGMMSLISCNTTKYSFDSYEIRKYEPKIKRYKLLKTVRCNDGVLKFNEKKLILDDGKSPKVLKVIKNEYTDVQTISTYDGKDVIIFVIGNSVRGDLYIRMEINLPTSNGTVYYKNVKKH